MQHASNTNSGSTTKKARETGGGVFSRIPSLVRTPF